MDQNTKVKHILDFFNLPNKDEEIRDGENQTDELYSLCDDPMNTPIQLIDEQLKLVNSSHITNLLVENTGFLVVGVLGFQGSGKSSILNILANNISSNSSLFSGPFATQQMRNIITNSPETDGVNLYITQDRIIILDTQPLVSLALTNHHIQKSCNPPKHTSSARTSVDESPAANLNGHRIPMPGGWAPEVWSEMASIQIVAFLFNVCHVVVVASDHLDSSLIRLHRLIDCASGLRPTVFTPTVISSPLINLLRDHMVDNSRRRVEHKGDSTVTTDQGNHSVVAENQPLSTISNTVIASRVDGVERKEIHRELEDEEDEELPASRMDDLAVGGDDDLETVEDRLTTTPSGLLRSRRAQQQQLFDTEPNEVKETMSWIRGLTRYSASLVHVYNSAPAAAFLDPVVRDHLHQFYHRLLPRLYTWSLRQDYLIDIGPCLLSAHARLRSRNNQSLSSKNVTTGDVARDTGSRLSEVPEEEHPDRKGLSQPETSSGAEVMTGAYTHSQSLPAPSDTGGYYATASVSECQLTTSQDQEQAGEKSLPSDLHARRRSSDPVIGGTYSQTSPPVHDFPTGPVDGSQEDHISVDSGGTDGPDRRQLTGSSTQPTFAVPAPPRKTDENRISPPVVKAMTGRDSSLPSRQKTKDVEAEIVTECCSVIQAVEADLQRHLLSGPVEASSTGVARRPTIDFELNTNEQAGNGTTPFVGTVDGEEISARMAKMSHHVNGVRSRFFNPVHRWDLVRLFLLPEVDDKGAPPLGCPSYADSAKFLQGAILSTPRQHMVPQMTEKKWFAYTENMWNVVCSSPLFSDYHTLLLSQIH